MINIPPIKSSAVVKPDLLTEITKTWRVGQVLNATTQQGGDALSKVLIQVGQHTLETKTPVALKAGEEIKLLIKSLGSFKTDNLPVFKLLKKDAPDIKLLSKASSPSLDISAVATSKLRQFIAVQQSFSQLLQLSNTLLSTPASKQLLPPALKTSLNNIQNTLQINPKQINVAQLKQHIINSGIFLESKLLKQVSATDTHQNTNKLLNNDFKFQLLTIKSELAPLSTSPSHQSVTTDQLNQLKTDLLNTGNNVTTLVDKLVSSIPKPLLSQLINIIAKPEIKLTATEDLEILIKILTKLTQKTGQASQQNLLEQLRFRVMLLDLGQQVEQSLSKISSLQLQPLSRDGDGLVLLLFNLIFKDNHEHFDINFKIHQDDDTAITDKESWKITLNFNFKTLGMVQSKIHLIDNQVATVFYTEFSETAEKIKPLIPLLKTGFNNSGLEVLNIDVVKGLTVEKPITNQRINLLDENV